MQNLVLDFGNTATKVAIFDSKSIVFQDFYEIFSISILKDLLRRYPGLGSCIYSTVIHLDEKFTNEMSQLLSTIPLDYSTPIPIINSYQTPQTLGKDRLSAAVGAFSLFPGENVLSIDAGTALKFDFINSDGKYLGGSISPGMKIRFQSLHTFTDKLPLISWQDFENLIGKTTQESILSGVINGMVAEIDGMINNYKTKFPDVKVVLSGGESIYFEKLLKNSIFAVPNLVLIGLNEILKFNEEKN